jgi:hypothetical protein
MSIKTVSTDKLEEWHNLLSLDNCPNHDINLPGIPYNYHEILGELIKREESESTLPPAEFMDYPIIEHDGNLYIDAGECHSDARTLTELYNEDKTSGLRACSIDVLPDHDGFYIRLEASR